MEPFLSVQNYVTPHFTHTKLPLRPTVLLKIMSLIFWFTEFPVLFNASVPQVFYEHSLTPIYLRDTVDFRKVRMYNTVGLFYRVLGVTLRWPGLLTQVTSFSWGSLFRIFSCSYTPLSIREVVFPYRNHNRIVVVLNGAIS